MWRECGDSEDGKDNITTMSGKKTFLEFFAGGGMARLGLGDEWACLFANDRDPAKCATYRNNFGGTDLVECDITQLNADDLPPSKADLVWGSFPCQDLSLAGARGGMSAERSGAFFPFWSLMEDLAAANRAPRIIALENVVGLLTSNGGRDFATVAEHMARAGYSVTACVLDAKHFTPQSRPRLFILGFASDLTPRCMSAPGNADMVPPALVSAHSMLTSSAKENWFWLDARPQTRCNARLSDIVEWNADAWHTTVQTQKLIAMMAPGQRARIDALIAHGARRAGAAFRRTRTENGESVQRVEARFDGLAGCLRTPAGGSSRQIIFAIENGAVRSRLLTPREAGRLMGLPEDYVLPESANAALKLAGDGVCVPVVRWLSEEVFLPALSRAKSRRAA